MTRRCLTVVALVVALGVLVHAALPKTDTFTRINENPLAGNWTAPDGAADSKFLLNSNHLEGQGGATFQLMYWNADTFGNDQKSQATLGGSAPTNVGVYGGVAVRIQNTGQNAYVFGDTNGAAYKIGKMASGTRTDLASCTGSVTVGDVLRLEVSGTTLTAFVNGASACSVADATYASGQGGLWGYGGVGNYALDDWTGDNLAAAGGCPKTFLLLGVGC